jgi:hypothetical protein
MSQEFTMPATMNGYGVISVTTASIAINATNVTLGPNSLPFPTASVPFTLIVTPQANATGYVNYCPLGGTAVMGNGLILGPGQSATKSIGTNLATTPPTLIASTGTISCYIEW